MGPGRDRTRDPWNCSQTRICSQTRYQLRYAAYFENVLRAVIIEKSILTLLSTDLQFSFLVKMVVGIQKLSISKFDISVLLDPSEAQK